MKFCIRVDDLGWTSESLSEPPLKRPDVGLRLAREFHAAMSGLPYLGAVIPTAADAGGREWLASAPAGLTVALHGLDHRRVDDVDCEYRGRSLDEVRERIALGREFLGSAETVHLVPPFNGLEPVVAEACKHEGIRYVWGGAQPNVRQPSTWPTPPQPHDWGRVTFVPSWAPLYGATLWRMGPDDVPLMDVLPSMIEAPGRAVLTLHLPWENAKAPDFRGVRELVELIGPNVISVEEYLS